MQMTIIYSVLERKDLKVVTDWSLKNYMSLNPTKCHYICLGKNKEKDTFNFENIFVSIGKKRDYFDD